MASRHGRYRWCCRPSAWVGGAPRPAAPFHRADPSVRSAVGGTWSSCSSCDYSESPAASRASVLSRNVFRVVIFPTTMRVTVQKASPRLHAASRAACGELEADNEATIPRRGDLKRLHVQALPRLPNLRQPLAHLCGAAICPNPLGPEQAVFPFNVRAEGGDEGVCVPSVGGVDHLPDNLEASCDIGVQYLAHRARSFGRGGLPRTARLPRRCDDQEPGSGSWTHSCSRQFPA
jgi:hypothetical protein